MTSVKCRKAGLFLESPNATSERGSEVSVPAVPSALSKSEDNVTRTPVTSRGSRDSMQEFTEASFPGPRPANGRRGKEIFREISQSTKLLPILISASVLHRQRPLLPEQHLAHHSAFRGDSWTCCLASFDLLVFEASNVDLNQTQHGEL